MRVGLLVPSFRIKAILTEPFAVVDTYNDVGHRFGYGRCDSGDHRGLLFHDVTILTIAYVSKGRTQKKTTDFLVWFQSRTEHDHGVGSRACMLDRGRVTKFDAPEVLLADKTSRFCAMHSRRGWCMT